VKRSLQFFWSSQLKVRSILRMMLMVHHLFFVVHRMLRINDAYKISVQGTYDTDNCRQACTDYKLWRHKSEWMSCLVRSIHKNQSYSIVRREASCFVSLTAPIGYCFLPRQVIPWRSFGFFTQIFLMYHFIFIIWWTIRIKCEHSNERIWTHLCVQYKLLPIQHCCGKFLKRFQSFTFYVQQFWKNFEKILQNFMNVATEIFQKSIVYAVNLKTYREVIQKIILTSK